MLYLISLPIIFLVLSVIFASRFVKKGKSARRVLATQMLSLFAVCFVCMFASIGVSAESNETAPTSAAVATGETAQEATTSSANGAGLVAVALATGLAIIGAGIAVASAAPAAIAANSENPKTFGKSMAFVGMAEGLAVLGVVISVMLLNKL